MEPDRRSTVVLFGKFQTEGGRQRVVRTKCAADGLFEATWALSHRYRSVMVVPGRDQVTGGIEVDETLVGGPQTGHQVVARRARCWWPARSNALAKSGAVWAGLG